jgi:hypothetical protein
MRFCGSLLFTIVLLSIGSLAQDHRSKPRVSDHPLTAEQVDIYRAVLKYYPKDSGDMLNVSDTTVPLEVSGRSFDKVCVEGIEAEQPLGPVPEAHKLSPSVLVGTKMKFVEPEPQENRIRVFTLSEIIFDKPHEHAIVSYSFGYSSCASGAILVLEWDGHGWAIKKSCGRWMSCSI